MAVRFVIGRAGTGKTHHCLHAITRQIADAPVVGPRLILLVPEQASLQTERALLDMVPGGVVHRAEVLSFKRLAYRILNHIGGPDRETLTTTGKLMLLRLATMRCRDRLTYYRHAERFGGFLEQLAATVSECISEQVSPESLRQDVTAADDPTRVSRLGDIALIYETYLELLSDALVDPTQHLELATQQVKACTWLNNAQIWVDGFAGFTGQERGMLVTLADVVASMDITMLMDRASADGAVDASLDLFSHTRRTLVQLGETFRGVGATIGEPVYLASSKRRFGVDSTLARLEDRLFSGTAIDDTVDASVEIIEADDQRTEVDYAVSRIVDAVQRSSDPLRYRDIAVIVRDITPYRPLLTASLESRGIPFFVDQRRPIARHPLLDWLRCLLELANGDYPSGVIRRLIRTGFVPISSEAADALDNYLLATDLHGAERWNEEEWPIPPRHRVLDESKRPPNPHPMTLVHEARDVIRHKMHEWINAMAGADNMTGLAWSEHLVLAATTWSCGETLDAWATEADERGAFELADLHRQVDASFAELCDTLRVTLGGETLSADMVLGIVESAVRQWTVGLAPSMLDQVLIGSIERSRNPDIKLALVLGFDDRFYPKPLREDTILNQTDRETLRTNGVELGPPRSQHLNDEALLAYIALTRASQHVVISYPRRDESGAEVQPSLFVERIRGILRATAIQHVASPIEHRAGWSILSPLDLALHIANAFRHRPVTSSDDAHLDSRILTNDLYTLAHAHELLGGKLQDACAALDYRNEAALSAESVRKLYRAPYKASVSSLESYAACPFQHYARDSLRLMDREVASLQTVDLGTFHHAILEQFVTGLVEDKTSLQELSVEQIRQQLNECHRTVVGSLPVFAELADKRDAYLSERATRELTGIMTLHQRGARAGKMRPARAELSFGFGDSDALAPLAITTPKNRQLLLRGFIDRVDLSELADYYAASVIDYKRSRQRRLDLSAAFHGTSLQLLAYLLVLQQTGTSLFGRPIVPVGAFFLPIRERYKKIDHPDDIDKAKQRLGDQMPRGLINTEHIGQLESDTDLTKWSPYHQVYRKSDGGFGHLEKSDVADGASFVGMLERTRHLIGAWADKWLDGDIAVSPYRLKNTSPCAFCDFKSVCRYEPRFTPIRRLPSMSRQEILTSVRMSQEPSDE